MAPMLNEEEAAIDPYAVLGVETTASEKEIKQAFRKMSLKCHPDRHPGEAAAKQFRQLTVSVEILTDAGKRAFLNTQLEAKRANKERYDKMHKKRQSGIDDLVARETAAKKARADRAAATVQLHAENEIKEQGRKLREEAQKRAYAAARPPSPPAPAAVDPDSQPAITGGDLTLSLQFPPSSATATDPSAAESSSQALQNALSARYGPISLVLLSEPAPAKAGKKPRGKKAVVEFAEGNWGGCWACWQDHDAESDSKGREVVPGLKANWTAGEAPKWVAWAERRRKAQAAVPSFTFDPSADAPPPPPPSTKPSAAFESETLLRMRQLDRQRALERERLEAQIRAEEGEGDD